jgi:hypothetical protein
MAQAVKFRALGAETHLFSKPQPPYFSEILKQNA